jgi:hypothetical protein
MRLKLSTRPERAHELRYRVAIQRYFPARLLSSMGLAA